MIQPKATAIAAKTNGRRKVLFLNGLVPKLPGQEFAQDHKRAAKQNRFQKARTIRQSPDYSVSLGRSPSATSRAVMG